MRKWSKQRVIEQLQAWQKQGVAVDQLWKQNQAMLQASYGLFGSWRKALAAAGITSVREQWSKKRVLAGILARLSAGERLERTWCEDRNLQAAAVRRFGSWQKALVAAGVLERDAPRRSWSCAKVIQAIQERRQMGLSLLGVRGDDAALFAAAQRHFGGWRKAVAAAGFDFPKRSWDRQTVIAAIQTWHRRGCALNKIWKDDPALSTAAYKYFGTFGQAVLAAGLEYTHRRRWTRELIVHEIRKWYPDGELKGNIWEKDRGLVTTVSRYFESWHDALRAAGIEPKRRMWSPDRVIEALQAWRRNPNGGSLYTAETQLAKAAAMYFGSINNALQAAGVEARPRKWTTENVIQAIQDRHVRGLTLRDGAAGQNVSLVSTAKRLFGSWSTALEAAGISDTRRRRWTKTTVIQELKHWRRKGRPVNSIKREYGALYKAISRRFESWSQALAAVELEDAQ